MHLRHRHADLASEHHLYPNHDKQQQHPLDHRDVESRGTDATLTRKRKRRKKKRKPSFALLLLLLFKRIALSIGIFILGCILVTAVLRRVRQRANAQILEEYRRAYFANTTSSTISNSTTNVTYMHVSVVIMNFNRPRMIRESNLVRTLAEHPNVDEILLLHANPATQFEYKNNKVRNLDAVQGNQQMGLALRFYHCSVTARNEWVIHVDDDQELTRAAIDELLIMLTLDPHRIVGMYGRAYHWWRAPQRHGYDTRNIVGPTEVVLTKLLIVERTICTAFLQYRHLVDDLLVDSHPLWNGEDIFLSLVANHEYGVPRNGPYRNVALSDALLLEKPPNSENDNDNNIVVWEASDEFKDDDTGEHDVSGNMDRHRVWNVGFWNFCRAFYRAQLHAAYRGRLWYTARQRLAALGNKNNDNNETT